MKALNLNGQGLLVLLFFVFTACNHWGFSPEAEKGSGKMVSVRIGAINVAGGYQNETVRASGGEKRMVGQPIVQDLGDGMFAEISVEEDVSALRDGEGTTLANNARYRVVVLDESDDYVAHKDFTMGADPEEITLEGNKTYHFICFSRNTSDKLPDAGTGGETGFTLAATTASELYWQKQLVTLPLEADVSFLLRPQYAKVTLELHAGAGRTFDINSNPGSISLDAATSGSFNLATGNFTFTSGPEGITFSGWSYRDDKEVFSNPITFLPKTTGEYTLTIPEEAFPLNDEIWPHIVRSIFIPAEKFEKEKSYTLLVTLKELVWSTNFAGSNIYWDGDKLTFDEHGNNDNTKYQGVFFKWGSLIGVAAGANDEVFSSGTTDNEGQNDGTPIYLRVNGEWKKTNVAYAASQNWISAATWDAIPYKDETSTFIDFPDEDAHSLVTNPDFEGYKGDICHYLKPGYRMPTLTELKALGTGDTNDNVPYKWTGSSAVTTSNATGRQELIQYGTFTGISGSTYYLPASGFLAAAAPEMLVNVGSLGFYWSGSGSANSGGIDAYALSFDSFCAGTGVDYRSGGSSIRCVKN